MIIKFEFKESVKTKKKFPKIVTVLLNNVKSSIAEICLCFKTGQQLEV